MKYEKKHESIAHSQMKLMEAVPDEAEILDLLHKHFKSTVLNILKEVKETRKTMYEQIENINKETEITKRSQYYSAIKRNEIGSFVEMWMDLETVIQSEVSQKEKNKYCILTHICGI